MTPFFKALLMVYVSALFKVLKCSFGGTGNNLVIFKDEFEFQFSVCSEQCVEATL